MPLPFETLIPYGIMVVMFGATGIGLATVKHFESGKKRPRYSVDHWDRPAIDTNPRVVMERDMRLTGSLRGQTDNPVAPPGFEYNNPWKLEKRIL
ncbi:unnamed protein product [Parascedosporium putredinis]|uniref:NADH dehydrogenase [ubiquinone] 1 alpha subcomplex subunit 1 n=1 Tax=Parascedosporium putredinis TaxID=1442378 RepID=A0A9P1H2E3_9PEZI|nr:unnamed protein product [Parascedosporium putredinis]CAI7996033.1 unnamed protein product [Parascedosporium putredinis]